MGENTKYLGSCHRIKWGMCCKVDIGGYPVVPLRILLVARGGGHVGAKGFTWNCHASCMLGC